MTQPTTVVAVPIWDTENGHVFDHDQPIHTLKFIDQMGAMQDDTWLCVIIDNGSDSEYTRDVLGGNTRLDKTSRNDSGCIVSKMIQAKESNGKANDRFGGESGIYLCGQAPLSV